MSRSRSYQCSDVLIVEGGMVGRWASALPTNCSSATAVYCMPGCTTNQVRSKPRCV